MLTCTLHRIMHMCSYVCLIIHSASIGAQLWETTNTILDIECMYVSTVWGQKGGAAALPGAFKRQQSIRHQLCSLHCNRSPSHRLNPLQPATVTHGT